MEICLQFCLLVLFGILFPISFPIALIWNVQELESDKQKLIRFTQKPLPLPEASIGPWMDILELVTYISICSNSAILTMTALRIPNNQVQELTLFLVLLIGFFLVKFILDTSFGAMPYRVMNLIKRHGYILRSTVEIFSKVGEKKGPEEEEGEILKEEEILQQFNMDKIHLLKKKKVASCDEISAQRSLRGAQVRPALSPAHGKCQTIIGVGIIVILSVDRRLP